VDQIPNSFFRIRFRILIEIFKMVPLIAFLCVLESVDREKSFPTELRTGTFFFSFKCLINNLYFTTASKFKLFSDSDPGNRTDSQHCPNA
jgi:hypothetical protein